MFFVTIIAHTSSSRADMVKVPAVCPSLKVTLPLVGLISEPVLEVVTSQSTVTSVNVPAVLRMVRVAVEIAPSNPGSSATSKEYQH